MKLVSWNSRGSAWGGFLAQAQFYAFSMNPDVFCIIDTRASDDILNKVIKYLPYDQGFVVPSQGQSGGLLLLWKSRMASVNIIFPHNRFIHCKVSDLTTNKSWLHTFVYIYPNKERQQQLWNEVLQIKPNNSDPWLLMGDFNNILNLEEKLS